MTFGRTISCKQANLFEYINRCIKFSRSPHHSFLHMITNSGVTTSLYLFHEVENTASLYCENNYNLRARVCVCVCLRPSTVNASSVWNSWDCQGTDQRCCVEDVGFLCRFPSSLLWNAELNLSASRFILFLHQKRAQPRLNQYTSRFQNIGFSFTINRRRLLYALQREPIYFCISTHERVRNLTRKG